MQYYPFDSRNPLYKDKFGAIAEGESLRLRLLLHRDACVHNAFLIIRKDEETAPHYIELQPKEWLEDYRFYDTELTMDEGLYWYSFKYTSDHGTFFVTKTATSLGIVSVEGENWQLTVYSKNFSTPDWLKGGLIYQIFPDRFAKSGESKKNVPEDRFICDDWEKQPEFRQNNGKCSLCNDYYCGDFKGIEQKLDYLKSLGVSCIYLNPIFEAHSNHRYNTADYMKIDCLLGNEKDFDSLIKKAKKKGISIILDGVFSHTGDDSIYFNKYKRYGDDGAFSNFDSPYHSWYKFYNFPHGYQAWWGVATLPETNEEDPSFNEFINGENGVIRHWLKKGIKGWRLDVADELPDAFLDNIRKAVKAEGEDNYLLGEVWEDATNKISYGARRRFLRGNQLDAVMNYPFANAIVDFVKGGNADSFMNCVLSILENYPKCSIDVMMNHIGTHDTARILTRLATDDNPNDRALQAARVLTPEEYERGLKRLYLAAVLQYTLPGVPSLYYGDETGLHGFSDPFCRATYPWGKENPYLLEFYKQLGNIRANCSAFKEGSFIPVFTGLGELAFIREDEKEKILIAVNRYDGEITIDIPSEFSAAEILFGNTPQNDKLTLSPQGFAILKIKKDEL